MHPTISSRRVDDQACVLLGSGPRSATEMAVTGVELALPIGVAMAVLVIGAALIIASRRRFADDSTVVAADRPVWPAVVVGLLAGLAISVAGITAPAGAESSADGCSLIEFTSRSSPGDIVIDGIPIEIQRVELRNATAFDIDVSFSTTVLRDDDGLAPFVEVTGACSCSAHPLIDATLAEASSTSVSLDGSRGEAIRMSGGQSVVLTLSAATTSAIGNPLQGASASYSLVAHARQAAA